MNMNNKMKLIGTIVGIVLFIILIAGISYAWFTWRSSNINIAGTTECFDIHYTNGRTITNDNVILFDENKIISDDKITIKKGMAITDVTAYIDSNCNIAANLEIILNVTNLNSAFISGNSVGAFKYVVASYDPASYSDITTEALDSVQFDIIKKDSITSLGDIILINESLTNTEKGYLFAFYVDGDLAMNDASNTTFEANITGVAVQVASDEPTPLSDFEYYLGSEHSTVTSIKYYSGNIGTPGDTFDAQIPLNENEVLLTRYIGDSRTVVIPNTYNVNGVTYNVTVLSFARAGDCATYTVRETGTFYFNENIESVTLGADTKFIEHLNCQIDYIYDDSGNLVYGENIYVSENSMYLLFSGCTSLVNVPIIPSTVTDMFGTFWGCTNLTGTVRINSSNVTGVSNIFYNTSKAITVEVPAGSTTYTKLSASSLPSNVTLSTFTAN